MATFFKQLPVSTLPPLRFYWLMMMFTFIFVINNSVLVFHPLLKTAVQLIHSEEELMFEMSALETLFTVANLHYQLG